MYMRFFLVLLTVENIGAVNSPVVTFNPDCNKIFSGESIEMTCDVDSVLQDVTYDWLKDGYWINSGKTLTISSAQESNSGSYQCRTSTGDRSDSSSLEVHNGYVILQVSPYVYEGDNLTLRCHHYPGYPSGQTIFYKDNAVIKGWGAEDELHIEMTSSSTYKCTKQVKHNLLYYQHTDETSVTVQELFSLPTIRLSPQSVTEGDHMTLTCHARISPLRQITVLQFAFYQDGQNIREFSTSNKYEILSAKQHNSGDYKCEVMASNYRRKKMSTTLAMQVKMNGEHELLTKSEKEVTSKAGTNHFITTVAVTSLGLVLALIVTAVIFQYRRRFQPDNNQQPSKVSYIPKVECEKPEEETENIYTDPDTINIWQNSLQKPHKPKVNDRVTENSVIV